MDRLMFYYKYLSDYVPLHNLNIVQRVNLKRGHCAEMVQEDFHLQPGVAITVYYLFALKNKKWKKYCAMSAMKRNCI